MTLQRARTRTLRGAGLAVIIALVFTTASCTTDNHAAVRASIVSIAQSQVGVRESPVGSNCNKFSAAFTRSCWEWCADFAAWAWRSAGIKFSYGYGAGQLNASAASFYRYAVARGTWHPVGSKYVPQPGDAVVFGLNRSGSSAAHVALVVSPGARGVNTINGNAGQGNTFVSSVQNHTATGNGANPISGYASPAF